MVPQTLNGILINYVDHETSHIALVTHRRPRGFGYRINLIKPKKVLYYKKG